MVQTVLELVVGTSAHDLERMQTLGTLSRTDFLKRYPSSGTLHVLREESFRALESVNPYSWIQVSLGELRAHREKPSPKAGDFRYHLHSVGQQMALGLDPLVISDQRNLVVVGVLRAGLPLMMGVRQSLPQASYYVVGAERVEAELSIPS